MCRPFAEHGQIETILNGLHEYVLFNVKHEIIKTLQYQRVSGAQFLNDINLSDSDAVALFAKTFKSIKQCSVLIKYIEAQEVPINSIWVTYINNNNHQLMNDATYFGIICKICDMLEKITPIVRFHAQYSFS